MACSIDKKILRSLLISYWLRPETALWYSAMLSQAKKFGVGNLEKKESLDFGCMDGINSYILLDGKLPLEFDAFYGMEGESSLQTKTTLQDDYYDQVDLNELRFNGDMPDKIFSYGIDWKKSHIERARLLKVHNNLILWDKQSSMQIKNIQLDLIWAPNIYWMDDLKGLLNEFNRTIKPGGTLITIVPNIKILDYLIMRYGDDYNKSWITMFDRGRFEMTKKSARSKQEWNLFFEDQGYLIRSCEGFISPRLMAPYEIGFRPMFSPLLNMRSLLVDVGLEKMLEVKSYWLDALQDILYPLVECDYFKPAEDESLWHMYKLEKN